MEMSKKAMMGIAGLSVISIIIFSLLFVYVFILNVIDVEAPAMVDTVTTKTVKLIHIQSDTNVEIVFNTFERVNNNQIWINGSLRCKTEPSNVSCSGTIPFTYKSTTINVLSSLLPFNFNVTVPAILFEKFNVSFGSATDIWTVTDATYFNTLTTNSTRFQFIVGSPGGVVELIQSPTSPSTEVLGGLSEEHILGLNQAGGTGTWIFTDTIAQQGAVSSQLIEKGPIRVYILSQTTDWYRDTYIYDEVVDVFDYNKTQSAGSDAQHRSLGPAQPCGRPANSVTVAVLRNGSEADWSNGNPDLTTTFVGMRASTCNQIMYWLQKQAQGGGLNSYGIQNAIGAGDEGELVTYRTSGSARQGRHTLYGRFGIIHYDNATAAINNTINNTLDTLARSWNPQDNTTQWWYAQAGTGSNRTGTMLNFSIVGTGNGTIQFNLRNYTIFNRPVGNGNNSQENKFIVKLGNWTYGVDGVTSNITVYNYSGQNTILAGENDWITISNATGRWWASDNNSATLGEVFTNNISTTSQASWNGTQIVLDIAPTGGAPRQQFYLVSAFHTTDWNTIRISNETLANAPIPNVAPQWQSNSSSCGTSVTYTSTLNCTYSINITDPDDSGIPRTISYVNITTNITCNPEEAEDLTNGICRLKNFTTRSTSLEWRVYNGSACGNSQPNQALYCLNVSYIARNSSYAVDVFFNDTSNAVNTTGLHTWTTVTTASPTGGMTFTLDGSAGGITKPFIGNDQSTTISSSETNAGDGSCTYTTFRNDTSTTLTTFYEARGQIFYNFSTAGCRNYTSGTINRTLTVNLGNLSIPLSTQNRNANSTLIWVFTGITNGTAINTTERNTGDDAASYVLRMNTSENNHITIFSSLNGTFNWTDYRGNTTVTFSINSTEQANYSAFLNSSNLAVLRDLASTGMTFTLDGSATDITKPYIGNGQTTIISSSETNTGDGSCTYTTYRNDTSTTLTTFYEARGQVFYNFSTAGCGNWSASSINRTLTINLGNLSIPLDLAPSGASQRLNGTIVWVYTGNDNATMINTSFQRTGADDATFILRRNTTENNHATLLSSPNGSYNFTEYRANGTTTYSVNSTAIANYSAFLNSSNLAVLRGDRTIPIRINNSLASSQVSNYINRSLPITINTTETYTGDDDSNYFVWVNGSNASSSMMGNISLTNFVNGSLNLTTYLGNSTWFIIVNDTSRANWSAINNFTTYRVLDTFTTYFEPKIATNFTTQATAWGFADVLSNNTYSDIWLNVTVNFTSRNSSHFVNTTNFTQLNFTVGSWFPMAIYAMGNNTNKTYVNNSNQTITFGAIGNTENITFMIRSANNLNYSTYRNDTGFFYFFRHHNVSQSFYYHAKVNATQQFNPQQEFVRYRVCTGTPIARNPPSCTRWSDPVNVIQSAEGSNNVDGYRINFFTEGTNFLRTNYTINVSSTSDLLLFATIEGGTYFTPVVATSSGGGGSGLGEEGIKNLSLKISPASKEFVILTSPEKPKPAVEKRTFNICNKQLFTVQLQPEVTGQYSDWVTKTTSPAGANVMILEPEACTNFNIEITIPAILKSQDYVIGIVLTDLLGQGKASLKLTVSPQPVLGIFQDFINWFIGKARWELRFIPVSAYVLSEGGLTIPSTQQITIPYFGLIGGVSILTATFFIMRRLKQFQLGRFASVTPLLFSVVFAVVWFAVLPV